MAENQAAWGIDIGQAGLKAVRLRYAEPAKQAMAVAFDYVPHPKILSQPDAIPEELIPQALETFLSRNDVKGDLIAIAVPGQTSLAKFIKLPPVEASKVSEIVKYEARQQIPFDLDDVIWDYQSLGGGVEESGFMLEAEVGLFAMKRDQVAQQMQPFVDAGQEVEIVQTAPLALYNFLSYDVLGHRTENGEPPENPEHTILLDMGADNTTLLVSNGRSIWIRNVPIGGNHFTRALTKEMKLTFAKAEHLKCNATRSPDPRAVFQALRPVFNDYVSEIQRSIGYFSSVNRDAGIAKVLGVGNGFKLAGLQKFLQQNLQYPVERVESYNGIVGDSVLNASLFQDNVMSFTVSYGLALQALGITRIHTSLLPQEIRMQRTIRRKKPWAIAGAAGLLGAFCLSAIANGRVYDSVSAETFDKGHKAVSRLEKSDSANKSNYQKAKDEHKKIQERGRELTGSIDRRELWLEVFKAINEAQPRDTSEAMADETDPTKKNRVRLTSITSQKHEELKDWFGSLNRVGLSMLKEDIENPPEGEGYVFTIVGSHYRDDRNDPENSGLAFLKREFLQNLQKWAIERGGEVTPVRQLGITHAVVSETVSIDVTYDPNERFGGGATKSGSAKPNFGAPMAQGSGGTGAAAPAVGGAAAGAAAPGLNDAGGGVSGGRKTPTQKKRTPTKELDVDSKETKEIREWQFKIQFAWKPTLKAERPAEQPAPKKNPAKK